MEEATKNIVELLQFLLPGFVMSWVFYGLTSHPKPSQFERTVEALIFTMFVQAAAALEEELFLWVGAKWASLGPWDAAAELTAPVVSGVGLGVLFAWLSHTDYCHAAARALRITSRASFPCEWFHAFVGTHRYVILHMKDERRLLGWPEVWPSDPARGHFVLVRASWEPTSDNPNYMPAEEIDRILVNVEDVRWVEFKPKEISHEQQPAEPTKPPSAGVGRQGSECQPAAAVGASTAALPTASAP